MNTKPLSKSRTIWTGASVLTMSVIAMILDIWSLIEMSYIDTLDNLFGPELVSIIGIAMIVLRVVTTQPVTVGGSYVDDTPDVG